MVAMEEGTWFHSVLVLNTRVVIQISAASLQAFFVTMVTLDNVQVEEDCLFFLKMINLAIKTDVKIFIMRVQVDSRFFS